MKSCTLFIAMDLMRSQTQVDMITGLQSPTKTGRPDWEAIFANLAENHAEEDVDVFFCGPPGLSKQLRRLSNNAGFGYRKENF